MLKVSQSLPDIAVLRGGVKDFKRSLQEGGDILSSLSKIGYMPLDVLIDKEGGWTAAGKPSDAHHIFTRAHTIIDTTRMKGEHYHLLARKMKIPLIFSSDQEVTLSREDLYRILRQQQIKVPETYVVRSSSPLKDSLFRELWTKYHTPILIRPLHRSEETSSRLIRRFHDLEASLRDLHARGIDVHILTYRRTPTTSIAVLPNFREQAVYTPLWVDTFADDTDIPTKSSRMSPHFQAPDFKKEHIRQMATKVYSALGLTTPACIDFIYHNKEYVVVNVECNPSLAKDGRFMKSLATTGVDVGQYIHEHIKHDLER